MSMLRSKQQGFTLIEILVAVLVLSVGVLGLVGMESLSLQNNQEAYHRSQATLLAYELADRMRANPDIEYNVSIPSTDPGGCVFYSGTPTACTSSALRQKDLYDWNQKISSLLPLGVGNTPVLSGGVYSISISWDNDKDGSLDKAFSFMFER